MNLKEAYRYANFLDGVLEDSYRYLTNTGFITTTMQKHLRSKADREAEDETVTLKKQLYLEEGQTPMAVVDFTVQVIEEKKALAEAITAAKAGAEINIDNAIALNKKKHRFVEVLLGMNSVRPETKIRQGLGYRFNVNNEQVVYRYDIEETTTIDFDRNDIRKLIKKYRKETDEISAKLDAIEINTVVDFIPKWDLSEVI